MKQIIYCGSTSDGYEYFLEFDTEDSVTGNAKQLRRKMGEIYFEEQEGLRNEKYPPKK